MLSVCVCSTNWILCSFSHIKNSLPNRICPSQASFLFGSSKREQKGLIISPSVNWPLSKPPLSHDIMWLWILQSLHNPNSSKRAPPPVAADHVQREDRRVSIDFISCLHVNQWVDRQGWMKCWRQTYSRDSWFCRLMRAFFLLTNMNHSCIMASSSSLLLPGEKQTNKMAQEAFI